jgi:hypothetical protein
LLLTAGAAGAQSLAGEDSLINRFNPFRTGDSAAPLDIPELCKRLDRLSEKLRDDGLVVVKQPDVFSQARLTRFRTEFNTEMEKDLANFQLVLAARINRLDAATTTQTSNLSAALAAPGSSAVHMTSTAGTNGTITVPGAPTAPPNIPSTATGTSLDISKGPFANLGVANAVPGSNPTAPLALGVDPTVYLDEKKRFLEHLNEIRRINLGPDQNDSSGYGLYLIRLPVSITPGEKTYHGFGADLAVTVEHEFGPDFVSTTFRNLVINDVVDQLAPVVYEVIRSGLVDKLPDPGVVYTQLKSRRDQFVNQYVEKILRGRAPLPADGVLPFVDQFLVYLLRTSATDPISSPVLIGPAHFTVARRIEALLEASASITGVAHDASGLKPSIESILTTATVREEDRTAVRDVLTRVIREGLYQGSEPSRGFDPATTATSPTLRKATDSRLKAFTRFLQKLYDSALPDDHANLDIALGVDQRAREETRKLAERDVDQGSKLLYNRLNFNLPSTRNPKKVYPLAPREVISFFLAENVIVLARDTQQALTTKTPRATDVRNYLRQALESAYNIMEYQPTQNSEAQPFANTILMEWINIATLQRKFAAGDPRENLPTLFRELLDNAGWLRQNMYDPATGAPRPLGSLCWAIALDAAMFDNWLKFKAPPVLEANGIHRELAPGQHFYLPKETKDPSKMISPETVAFFQEFVRTRWPLITFALDPVTDQQNVADSFNLKRDLQLAVSYAFATGQISFGQLNTFRRQIEQSSDTIALNRTITGFAHGNDTFGFRFAPRFQNPPSQRTNLGVIASQLISGGPGPDYQIKKSKLEAGMREITAVVLVPTFLPTMRMNIATNWFRLDDPEHLVFHSARAMERGRAVQELRQAAVHACSAQQYRDSDVRVLMAKLKQLEQMLPQQSRVVQLPFENTASGWDLFSDGATALVPELTGYDGAEILTQGIDADVFIYGKYIHLLDTKVVVGGAYLPSSMVDIISREVLHVHIPATALPTTTVDGKSYFEVYLATPSGISNRVLVPCRPKSPPPPNGYDLATDASSQELDVFYQWMNGNDGKPTLILTDDPGAVDRKPLKIAWDAPTGFAPKTLQANFQTTLATGQEIRFSLRADSGTKDEYAVDRRQIALVLMKRIEPSITAPALLPASLRLTVSVQPYVPLESMGYRVLSKAKPLNTPCTVKFIYHATDKNALPGLAPVTLDAPRSTPDAAILRTAMPQTPLSLPPLATAPGVDPTRAPLPPLPGVPAETSPGVQHVVGQAGSAVSQPSNQATLATPPASQIVVNPAPVVVVPPPARSEEKPRSHWSRFFDRRRRSGPASQR